jgi:hypothetical protein
VLVYMNDGSCIEVEEAQAGRVVNGALLLFNSSGIEVANFKAREVEAFTADEEMADVMLDEVCEELTVLPATPEADEETDVEAR